MLLCWINGHMHKHKHIKTCGDDIILANPIPCRPDMIASVRCQSLPIRCRLHTAAPRPVGLCQLFALQILPACFLLQVNITSFSCAWCLFINMHISAFLTRSCDIKHDRLRCFSLHNASTLEAIVEIQLCCRKHMHLRLHT